MLTFETQHEGFRPMSNLEGLRIILSSFVREPVSFAPGPQEFSLSLEWADLCYRVPFLALTISGSWCFSFFISTSIICSQFEGWPFRVRLSAASSASF